MKKYKNMHSIPVDERQMKKKQISVLRAVTVLVCSLTAAFAFAQTGGARNGLSISVPNGDVNIAVDDMSLASTAGPVVWSRSWNGREWKFNPQWESLSQSWTNLTGGMTSAPAQLESSSESACYVMVDEDWQPRVGQILIDEKPVTSMEPNRTVPFNRIMGEGEGEEYPPPRFVNIDYAALCLVLKGAKTSPAIDLEAIRRKNELYLGGDGRYSYSNRTYLEKRAVRELPAGAAATVDAQLAAGSIALAPVTRPKGYRWMDRAGEWIEYNVQGQVVAYGDKNNNTIWMVRDLEGTLRGIVDAYGRVLYTIHYNGKLVAEVRDYPMAGKPFDLPARSVKYEYDAANRLVKVIDVRGNNVRYSYDSSSRITVITDQENREEKLSYAGNSVETHTAPDGGVTNYTFDYEDATKEFTSRIVGPETNAGRRTEVQTHSRTGQLVRRVVNGRVDEEVRYDSGARAVSRTNARGFTSRVISDEFDMPVQNEAADGTVVKFEYSAVNLQLLTLTDQAGIKTQFEYDNRGNLLKTVEAVGTPVERTKEYEVNDRGQMTNVTVKGRTEANGTVTPNTSTTAEYNLLGLPSKINDGENKAILLEYNRLGRLTSFTDPNEHTSRFEVNAQGLLTRSEDALRHSHSIEYDRVGNPISLIDAESHQVRSKFDAMNRVLESRERLNSTDAVRQVTYDAAGLPAVLLGGDGEKTKLGFDNFWRLIEKEDGLGNKTRYGYQVADGTQSGSVGSLVAPTETIYPTYVERKRFDQLERLTLTSLMGEGALDRVTANAYDVRGLDKRETDAYKKDSVQDFDALGQVSALTDRNGKKTYFQYDVRGNLIQVTDANGHVRRYEYDRNNREVAEILPMGQMIRRSYDAVGNLTELTQANGSKQRFNYDDADRLIKVTQFSKDGTQKRQSTYTWDSVNNLTGWADDDGGIVASGLLSRDSAQRLTGETVTFPGGFSMAYAYVLSPGGKKTELVWPDGTHIGYGYNKLSQLDSVTIPGEGLIGISQFNWFMPAATTLPGGTVQKKTYSSLLDLVEVQVTAPNQQAVYLNQNTIGSLGEPSASSYFMAQSGRTVKNRYGYDDASRLLRVEREVTGAIVLDVETFTLDPVGNRTAHSRTSGAWIYDENNRLKQQGIGQDAIFYDYDMNGNLVSKTESGKVTRFVYDLDNRLIEVRNGSEQLIARYGYDPLGRRIWKEYFRTKDGSVLAQALRTFYLHAEEGIVGEATQAITLNPDDGVTANSVPEIITQYGLKPDSSFMTNVIFIKTKNSNRIDTIAYYHHDVRGAPVLATDRNGNVVWAADYDAFGRAQIVTPEPTPGSPTISSDLRFPGQIEDVETGLHYNYFRDYDPETGRYIESDPIGLIGGVNTYLYANGNPVFMFDPYGLWAWGDPLPQGMVDFTAGFGDTISMGGTGLLRSLVGIDGGIDKCSPAYAGGAATGVVWGVAWGGATLGRHAKNVGEKYFFRDKRTYGTVQDIWSKSVGGYKGKYELHHWWRPQSKGGTSAGWNLVPVSPWLNRRMSDGGKLFNIFRAAMAASHLGAIGTIPTATYNSSKCDCK